MAGEEPRPPDRGPTDGERRSRSGRVYSLFVGAAFITLVVVVLFNTLGGADETLLGAGGIEGAEIIRVCDLFDRPLAISFWFTRGADCLPTQDVVDRAAVRYRGRVNFLTLHIGDDREDVREIVRDRGWRIPVGYDADGAVSNLYRVGGCPTAALAYPGGILAGGVVGEENFQPEALAKRLDELIAESRRRAETDR